MSHFIEVYGESEYLEYPNKIVMDVDVTVRAAKLDTAQKELKEIVNRILDQLFAAGLTKEEVTFGGSETFTPWWKRKKTGVENRNRISIVSSDRVLVYSTLENIDQYQNDKRITVSISERQPIFEPLEDAEVQALKEACANAFTKASALASATGVKVGKPLEIQEHKRGVRNSGSYGDYDYGDYAGLIAAADGGDLDGGLIEADETPAARLEGNSRIVFIKYRVKYAIE